jgi:hypothetical protein
VGKFAASTFHLKITGRILKGEKSTDLPIQPAAKIELTVFFNAVRWANLGGLEQAMSLLSGGHHDRTYSTRNS